MPGFAFPIVHWAQPRLPRCHQHGQGWAMTEQVISVVSFQRIFYENMDIHSCKNIVSYILDCFIEKA